MEKKKFDLENFPTSESAKRMLSYVTENFYDESYVGKWIYQVMGEEYDKAFSVITEEAAQQLFVETATWGLFFHEIKWQLPIRENLSYEERRKLIYEKRDYRAPMTPYRMEKYLSDVIGMEVCVADIHDKSRFNYVPDHPNRFRVFFVGDETLDTKAARALINKLKQSHTTYTIRDVREIIFDETGLEDMKLTNVRFDMGMYFWFDPNGGTIFHNGMVLHNGEILHNQGRRYNLLLGIRQSLGSMKTTETMYLPRVEFSAKMETPETVKARIIYHSGMDFWGIYKHNGALLHNGEVLHDERRGSLVASVNYKASQTQTEDLGEATIFSRTRNLYFHDGTYNHDGVARHRTVYKKEVAL